MAGRLPPSERTGFGGYVSSVGFYPILPEVPHNSQA
jgi:hypothetical protein